MLEDQKQTWLGWMMWIMQFFFCHLVARFTSAWMHLPSDLCTCSIAKTTTMHERSGVFCLFATLSLTESESLKIWTSHPAISLPPSTPNAAQSTPSAARQTTIDSSALLRLCVHVSEEYIHQKALKKKKKCMSYEILKEDLGAQRFFKTRCQMLSFIYQAFWGKDLLCK